MKLKDIVLESPENIMGRIIDKALAGDTSGRPYSAAKNMAMEILGDKFDGEWFKSVFAQKTQNHAARLRMGS